MSALPADTSTPARIQISDFAAIGAANYAAGLGSATDRDWIAIDLVAGHAYRFEAALSGSGAQVSLRLADATGTTVGTAGTITGSGNAALAFTATTTGTYYIDIGSANGVVGAYDVVAIDRTIRPIATIETLTSGNDSFVAATGGTPQLSRGLEGNDRIEAGGVLLGQQGNDQLTAIGDGDLLYGGEGNDVLTAETSQVFVDGGRGNDTFISMGVQLNVDLAWSRNGADQDGPLLNNVENVTAGNAADIIYGSDVGNRLDGGSGDDMLYGRDGGDILWGRAGSDTIDGGGGDDRIEGGDGSDIIDGGDGDDLLIGGDGNDTIHGGDGKDYFVGGAGADTINGGSGSDTVSYFASNAAVNVDLRLSSASGGDAQGDILTGIENLIGSAYDDVIVASTANNAVIIGGAGADRITGYAEASIVLTYASYETSTADLTIDLANGIFAGGEAEGDQLVSIRGIIGGAGNDVISAQDMAMYYGFYFNGGDGDDILTGGSDGDVLKGQAGHDVLLGGDGGDRLYADAEGGDHLDGQGSLGTLVSQSDAVVYETELDVSVDLDAGLDNFDNTLANIDGIETSGGDDEISLGSLGYYARSGAGDDIITAGTATAYIEGGTGFDVLDLSYQTTAVVGSFQTTTGTVSTVGGVRFSGIDQLRLGSGNDTMAVIDNTITDYSGLFGGDGNDTLTAASRGSRLEGEAGDDTLVGAGGADKLLGGTGTDTVSYAGSGVGVTVELISGTTIASGGHAEGDVLVSIENLTGSAHNDRLHGGNENNVFIGGGGDDILLGRGGADVLTGGDGADRFAYSAVSQSFGIGRDTIVDFTRADGDRIDLATIDANSSAAGNQAFSFIGTDAFTGNAGELRVTSSLLDTRVEADINGDGVADMDILVLNTNPTTFIAGDFLL